MKFVRLFLAGVAVCALNACEKHPYSQIESIESVYPGGAHHAEAKAPEKGEPSH